jgi:hypothetical protein
MHNNLWQFLCANIQSPVWEVRGANRCGMIHQIAALCPYCTN